MRTTTALLPLALLPAALAQNNSSNSTFLAGLVGTLASAGLTQLVSVASSLNGTTFGQQLLTNLSSGPYLIFAPNNDAWSKAPKNVTGNQTALTDVFAYHLVPGNFSGDSSTYPNVTLGQTLLRGDGEVFLEGNKPQVVAWAVRDDNKTHVLNQRNDSTVVDVKTFENITILVVDHVLNPPESFEATIPTNNNSLTGFETLLKSATLSFYNSSTNSTGDVTFFEAINEGWHGFTLFSPNNTAIDAANSTLASLAGNRTATNAVLFNHIINGTTIYSPLLTGGTNYTSAGGVDLSFHINSTGQYVTSGNFTAKILQPDVLLPNGVVHIIDTVLANTDADSSAASSA
ncbi:FAS1 domain-containing protein [Trametopsis cervina]|nr:FAS1 domain-containing protein [Trametopsis cervina]